MGEVRVTEIDAWLVKQCEYLSEPMKRHVMANGSLGDPVYRLQLGQHQAYMRVRSFVSGAIRALGQGEKE